MRFLLSLALTLTSICFFSSSCTKSSTPATTIVGFWNGTFQANGYSGSYPYRFDLRPDSTLSYKGTGADNNIYYGEGTYSLSGTNFSFSFTVLNLSNAGVVQTGTGTYNATAGTITGNWQNQGSPTSFGTYSISKIE
jgi:hypothetical protein